jgi:hypothetical protein
LKNEPRSTSSSEGPGAADAASIAEELRRIIERQIELERELLGLRDRATTLAVAMKALLEARIQGHR